MALYCLSFYTFYFTLFLDLLTCLECSGTVIPYPPSEDGLLGSLQPLACPSLLVSPFYLGVPKLATGCVGGDAQPSGGTPSKKGLFPTPPG